MTHNIKRYTKKLSVLLWRLTMTFFSIAKCLAAVYNFVAYDR